MLPFAALHQRAGVFSTTYVLCFLAMGLPAVLAGMLVTHVGVLTTAREYGAIVMVLAGLALLGMARRQHDVAATA